MNLKTTLIVAIVALALGGYIYFYERETIEETDSEWEKVFDIESADIEEIEIVRAEGEDLKLIRTDESWTIVSPIEARADTTEVETLTGNIADLESERVVAEGDAVRLGDFGLAEPDLEVRYKTEQDDSLTGLLFGDETPTGTNRYAKLAGEDKVFVISSYLKSNFEKETWDLRDKKILYFNPEDVERLIMGRPDGELVLAKASADQWNVASPGFCRADRYKASSLVSRFETAKMEEIVSESADNLTEYGLAPPIYQVHVELKGGTSAKLLVGNEIEGRYYARTPNRDLIYLISSSLVDDIKKGASEYRSKRLFEFATYQVDKFQIASAGEPTRVIEKTKEAEDDETMWAETAPQARDLDRTLVEDLLYKMNGTDAQGFAADSPSELEPYGLLEPALTITVWVEGSESAEELTVGKPEGEWVYARRKGDEPVLQINATDWEALEQLMSFEKQEPEEEEEQ